MNRAKVVGPLTSAAWKSMRLLTLGVELPHNLPAEMAAMLRRDIDI